ncbi:uncharacterized protein (TIGR02453 family) [Enterobacillus tribolii]|uniref:Uncharacterized protein (TIGR02453 family) n=2 Tax=Enterobacillus tribolii TaxID=1487935 RepID=A0A370R4X4_9GAMM|nr:uncharacterized protein (TIGR02453 family) [Enterobacillus tribolii]
MMADRVFRGFTQQGLNFLQQVRQENSKEWFDDNRKIYDENLLTPFRDLVSDLSDTMLKIDDRFETRPAIGKTLSRINRDTRFSNDKSRYRSRLWLTFKRHSPDWKDAPVYFFEISPDAFRYGLGYYSASRATMDRFRHLIVTRPQAFREATACCKPPFELVGDSYKRTLIKDAPADVTNWYNRKSFAVMATSLQIEQIFDARLVPLLEKGFTRLAPLYHFLMQAEALKAIPLEDL